jgi:hypothetical protein
MKTGESQNEQYKSMDWRESSRWQMDQKSWND